MIIKIIIVIIVIIIIIKIIIIMIMSLRVFYFGHFNDLVTGNLFFYHIL